MTEEKSDQKSAPEPLPAEKKSPRKGKGEGFGEAIWKLFSSVKLAIILLLLLAVVSIIGTVLAQGDSAQDNLQLFENWVVKVYDFAGLVDADDPASVAARGGQIRTAAERLYRFSQRANFTNLYHAWYFYLLLALFSLNLIVCTIKRWPITWRLIARNQVRMEEKRLRAMASRQSLSLDLSPAEARERVLETLRKARYSPKVEEEGGTVFFFGQKGVYSRLGVYATHVSILVILAGGIIGVTSGFKGYMQIVEGTEQSRFYDRRAKKEQQFDFSVRCDDFQVEYYEGTRRPKDFFSDLTVLKDGVEIKSKRIEVNDPLTYEPTRSPKAKWPVIGWFYPSIWFYQSSYGDTGRGSQATFRITDPATGKEFLEKLDTRPLELPELGVTVRVLQVLPDFAMDNNQKPYSKSNQPSNPAALVEVTTADGTSSRTWLFQRYPDAGMDKNMPVKLGFVDYGGIQYTGLQVVYDPGVWVIWTGCSLMVIGLYLAFFMSHRRIWGRIDEKEGGLSVLLAGSASKNREAFGEELGRLADRMAGREEKKAEA